MSLTRIELQWSLAAIFKRKEDKFRTEAKLHGMEVKGKPQLELKPLDDKSKSILEKVLKTNVKGKRRHGH